MKLKYIYKAIEKDLEERTVKHPVTERARNIGASAKKGDKYRSGGKDCYDIIYGDGTRITYEIEEEGEYKKVGTEHRVLYIPNDEDLEEASDMAEPFAIDDRLEERIFEHYPELEDNFYIDDAAEFDGEGWEVPVTVQDYIHSGKTIDVISSVTTPDGETISMIQGNGADFYEKYPGSAITDDNRGHVDDVSEAFTTEAYGQGGWRRATNGQAGLYRIGCCCSVM